eukprot:5192265-Pyramimonas_sp.AAC.1
MRSRTEEWSGSKTKRVAASPEVGDKRSANVSHSLGLASPGVARCSFPSVRPRARCTASDVG